MSGESHDGAYTLMSIRPVVFNVRQPRRFQPPFPS